MSADVIVLGGGASGLMAAIMAARAGASVTLLEQNERPGRKLLASGNGKCNLTNHDMAADHFHGGSPERIAAVLSRFDADKTLAFFRELGLEVFDRDGWVYPVTEQASSVCELLLLEASRLSVKGKYSERALAVEVEGGRFCVRTEGWSYRGDALILACGSPASAVRGASDDALAFAKSFGLRTQPFGPALAPLRVSAPYLSAWAGVRATAAGTLFFNGNAIARTAGEFQFTEHGVSGIPVMQISHLAQAAEGRELTLRLDLVPRMAEERLAARLSELLFANSARTLEQAFLGLLPGKLIPLVCAKAEECGNTESEALCAAAARAAKGFEIPISGVGALSQAQVCSGGVCLEELTDDLQSRAVPGLFFCGECVDVHGDCGGYNLQWAWSSGAVAGSCAAEVKV